MDNIDILVFVSYCTLILSIGLYVSRDKKGKYVGDDKSTPNVNEAFTTVNVRKDNLKPAQKRRLKRRGIK